MRRTPFRTVARLAAGALVGTVLLGGCATRDESRRHSEQVQIGVPELANATLQVSLSESAESQAAVHLTYPAEFFGECPTIVLLPDLNESAAGDGLADLGEIAEELSRHGFMVASIAGAADRLKSEDVDVVLQVLREHPRVHPSHVFAITTQRDLRERHSTGWTEAERIEPLAGWIVVSRSADVHSPDFASSDVEKAILEADYSPEEPRALPVPRFEVAWSVLSDELPAIHLWLRTRLAAVDVEQATPLPPESTGGFF